MKDGIDTEMRDRNHNDPKNWKGIFYFNLKDSRVIVPKYNPSMGWTLNFGNIYLYFVIAALIVVWLVFYN